MKKLLTMICALTITSSITPLTVEYDKTSNDAKTNLNKETEVKIEPFDINSITAKMIINWVEKYEWKDYTTNKTISTTPETLKDVDSNDALTNLLRFNIENILLTKITGMKKRNVSGNSEGIDYLKLNDAEIRNYANFYFLSNNDVIDFKVLSKNEENTKKYIATIEIKNWNEINKNDQFKNQVIKKQQDVTAFLNLTDEAKKDAILKENPHIESDKIENEVKQQTDLSKLWQHLME